MFPKVNFWDSLLGIVTAVLCGLTSRVKAQVCHKINNTTNKLMMERHNNIYYDCTTHLKSEFDNGNVYDV